MLRFKKILFSVLSVLTGLVFIVSAISKLPSLEQFGWTITETTLLNWAAAEWSARILIGLELFLGVIFIFHIKIRKIAIPLSLFLLSVFTVYLLLVIKLYGTHGNCGCFGEWIPMTPLQSVVKNLVLIGMILTLLFSSTELQFKYVKQTTFLLLLLSLSLPLIWLPPESIYIYEKENPLQKPIPLSLLYHSEINKVPAIELRKGKHIISFMSLTCRFCRKAAKRFRIMKEKHPELPIYLVLNGDSKNLPEFFEDTRAQFIDHSLFNGAEQFTQLNDGYSLPTIKWVQDTTVVRESNYLTIDENEILDWMKKGK
jgi:hypothetical protein